MSFYLDTEELQQGGYMVAVRQGKTGRRLVWACYPEWVDQFELRSPQLPPVKAALTVAILSAGAITSRIAFPLPRWTCAMPGRFGHWNAIFPMR